MSSQAQQAMERDELLRHRREGGLWLREMREKAGLSQRELAAAVGADYYSFVSQLESGKGRVPVAQVELWARALKVPRSVFARGLLKHYDPITYDMLFGDEETSLAPPAPEEEAVTRPQAEHEAPKARLAVVPPPLPQSALSPPAAEPDEDLRARINRLEAILMMRGAAG